MEKNKKIILIVLPIIIIILVIAIILGITITHNTINNSKKNNFETDMQKAYDYLEQQAKIMINDISSVDEEFKNHSLDKRYSYTTDSPHLKQKYNKLGFTVDDVRAIAYLMKSDGTACIKVIAIPKTSKYYNENDWELIQENNPKIQGYYRPKKDSDIKYQLGSGC